MITRGPRRPKGWRSQRLGAHYSCNRNRCPDTAIEVLTPDFKGDVTHLDTVLDAQPDIFNHNLETIERLQKPIRRTAAYQRSLDVLRHAGERDFTTKSGLMLGIGEKPEEIGKALKDLRSAEVNILTLGQYLQPTPDHVPVDRGVTPEEFEDWKKLSLDIGFDVVESGPIVRSSYHAEDQSEHFGTHSNKVGAA